MKRGIRSNIISMCDEAWYIFINAIKLSVFLLGLSCILYSAGYGISAVQTLSETAQAILLIAIIGSRCVEAQISNE